MTMIFRVADPALPDVVEAGNELRLIAEEADRALTVMKIERAK